MDLFCRANLAFFSVLLVFNLKFYQMKILHTSDWHIGQRLHNNDREDEHRHFFDWLKQTIISQNIDALLVCGDIFDIGFPANGVLKIYYSFLTSLIVTNCRQVIITGGNHDSVSTLEAPKDILGFINVTVIGGATEAPADEIIEIHDAGGKTQAVVCAVPFLREKNLRKSIAGESFADRENSIREGILSHYLQLSKLTETYQKENIPVIATGHLFVQGAVISESERGIYVGNQAGVSVSAFPQGFGYLALGHLHRAQQVGSKPPAFYSGSPLMLSFSEQFDKKQVNILEISDGKTTITNLKIPAFRKLISINGSLAEAKEKLALLKPESPLCDWIELNVEEPIHDPLLMRLYDDFIEDFNLKNIHFKIIKNKLRFTDRSFQDSFSTDSGLTLSDFNERQVFEKLLDQEGIFAREDLISNFNQLLQMVHETDNQE